MEEYNKTKEWLQLISIPQISAFPIILFIPDCFQIFYILLFVNLSKGFIQ